MNAESFALADKLNPSRVCRPILPLIHGDHLRHSGLAEEADRIFLALELTRRCNLFCKHCYVSARPDIRDQSYVSAETWLRCLNDARRHGVSSVQMIGGEPTLHPILSRLVGRAGQLAFRDIEVFANATRLDTDLLLIMRQNKARLATSLYGATAEQHDGFTRVMGSFAHTCRNIRHALAEGIDVRVAVVRHAHEVAIIEETSRFARLLGANEVSADVVRAFGRGKNSGSREMGCGACGVSVLRVCTDGEISGCSMSPEPKLGQISDGIEAALRKLTERGRAAGETA